MKGHQFGRNWFGKCTGLGVEGPNSRRMAVAYGGRLRYMGGVARGTFAVSNTRTSRARARRTRKQIKQTNQSNMRARVAHDTHTNQTNKKQTNKECTLIGVIHTTNQIKSNVAICAWGRPQQHAARKLVRTPRSHRRTRMGRVRAALGKQTNHTSEQGTDLRVTRSASRRSTASRRPSQAPARAATLRITAHY